MITAPSSAVRVAIVAAFWAAIYLPGLGSLEIKGEEGRRILPAVTMLQTGNYLVPQVGSEPYFRKPPLVNWLVAASFKIFGNRTEWSARLPSALSVLAVAVAFVTIAPALLGARGSLVGALVWLTSFGPIEKGRLIEIEALYVSLFGLAILTWLSFWNAGRSKWLTWVIPSVFLGGGLLAKGPLHLVFFYAIVAAVLARSGELRTMWNSAHGVGILLMVAIFAAWAVPCLLMLPPNEVAHTWSRQFTGRLSGEDFKLSGWLMNIPRGLGYFLPWTPLLALIGRATFGTQRTKETVAGLSWGMAGTFLVVSLLPGSLPRYTMPLVVPAACVVALLLTAERFELPRWLQFKHPAQVPSALRLPLLLAAAVGLALGVYALFIIPRLQQRSKIKTVAAQINAALSSAEPLYAVDPDYQPFLFYVRDPVLYVSRIRDLPVEARYLLLQPEKEAEALASEKWLPARAQPILRLKDYRKREVTILEVRPVP